MIYVCVFFSGCFFEVLFFFGSFGWGYFCGRVFNVGCGWVWCWGREDWDSNGGVEKRVGEEDRKVDNEWGFFELFLFIE